MATPGEVGREHAFYPLFPVLLALLGPLGDAGRGGRDRDPGLAPGVRGMARLAPLREDAARAVALACLPCSFALALLYPDGLTLAGAGVGLHRSPRRTAPRAAGLGVIAGCSAPGRRARRHPRRLAWPGASAVPRAGAWRRRRPGAGALAAQAVLWQTSGDLLAFTHAQDSWGRGQPWDLVTSIADVSSSGHYQTLVEAAIAISASALPAALPAGHGGAVGLAAAAVLIVSLGSGSFQSIGRHALLAFPLAWMAADAPWPRPRRTRSSSGSRPNVALLVALWVFAP